MPDLCAHACSNQAHAVAENFARVEHVWGDECAQSSKCQQDCRQDCTAQPGYTVPLKEVKRVALFHYVTRYFLHTPEFLSLIHI